MKEAERESLEEALGHQFARPQWLERALTHRSHPGDPSSPRLDNERLEYLGDSILGFAVSDYLVELHPDWNEGMLSKARARLVSAPSLEAAAQRIRLGRYLRLGAGEEKTGGREKRKLLAGAYEAVIGAIFRDAGLEAAKGFVHRSLLDPAGTGRGAQLAETDQKSALQEWLQKRGMPAAQYRVVRESGPDHRKVFMVEVCLGSERLAEAEGSSKKMAEQAAAAKALAQIRNGEITGR